VIKNDGFSLPLEGQPCYIVPFCGNIVISNIDAATGGEVFLTLHMCIEGNCDEQIKVTESFDIYVKVSCGGS
jgi:hypothetical protein